MAESIEKITENREGGEGIVNRCVDRIAVGIANRPCLVACTSCFCMLLMAMSVAGTGLLGFSEASAHEWTISSNVESERLDAYEAAVSMADSAGNQTVVARSNEYLPFYVMMEWRDGRDADILEPAALKLVCELETLYFNTKDYDKYCLVNVTSTATPKQCSPLHPLSLTRLFYGSTPPTSCAALPAATVRARASEIYSNATTARYLAEYGFFLSSDFGAGHLFTQRTRTALSLGSPLEGYSSLSDRRTEQDLKYREFFKDLEKRLWERFGMSSTMLQSAYQQEVTEGEFRIKFFAANFQALEFSRLINSDLTWTAASILFVFLYIAFHTGSLFIASGAMFQIIISLPVAFFVYRLPLQIPYFAQLHVLVIFLVLGIGADDVFVLVDAWKQSAREVDMSGPAIEVERRRMRHAYSHTVFAVFNTSFTTAMAFIATGISPIMPISSFGWFAALAIIFNYIFVVSFTPAVLMIWHRHIRPRGCCGCCCKHGRAGHADADGGADDAAAVADVELAPRRGRVPSEDGSGKDADAASPAPVGGGPQPDVGGEQQAGLVERTYTRYAEFMLWEWKGARAVAIASLVVLGGVAIFFAVRAAKLRPPTQEEAWFADNHMFTGIGDELRKEYLSGSDDEYREMYVVYGIDGIDRTGFNRYIPSDNRGSPVFADTDLASATFQRQYVEACEAVKTYPCTAPACFNGKLLLLGSAVDCVVSSVYAHHNAVHNTTLAPGDLTDAAYVNAVKAFRAAPTTSSAVAEMGGVIDGNLKYMAMRFTSSMQANQPSARARAVHDVVTRFVDEKVKPRPAFHVAGPEWTWMETQDALVSNMFTGLAICFPVAFAVLVIATGNIVLAFYAVVTIALIVCVVLGFVESAMHWELGVAQSIATVIIVGFSIDYCVHLAHMYEQCPAQSRGERLAFALSKMGGTVLGGGLTTLGAALPMALAKMTFFTTMAVLLTTTIVASLLFAQVFFVALLAVAGPEGHCGDVRRLARRACGQSRGTAVDAGEKGNRVMAEEA